MTQKYAARQKSAFGAQSSKSILAQSIGLTSWETGLDEFVTFRGGQRNKDRQSKKKERQTEIMEWTILAFLSSSQGLSHFSQVEPELSAFHQIAQGSITVKEASSFLTELIKGLLEKRLASLGSTFG